MPAPVLCACAAGTGAASSSTPARQRANRVIHPQHVMPYACPCPMCLRSWNGGSFVQYTSTSACGEWSMWHVHMQVAWVVNSCRLRLSGWGLWLCLPSCTAHRQVTATDMLAVQLYLPRQFQCFLSEANVLIKALFPLTPQQATAAAGGASTSRPASSFRATPPAARPAARAARSHRPATTTHLAPAARSTTSPALRPVVSVMSL